MLNASMPLNIRTGSQGCVTRMIAASKARGLHHVDKVVDAHALLARAAGIPLAPLSATEDRCRVWMLSNVGCVPSYSPRVNLLKTPLSECRIRLSDCGT